MRNLCILILPPKFPTNRLCSAHCSICYCNENRRLCLERKQIPSWPLDFWLKNTWMATWRLKRNIDMNWKLSFSCCTRMGSLNEVTRIASRPLDDIIIIVLALRRRTGSGVLLCDSKLRNNTNFEDPAKLLGRLDERYWLHLKLSEPTLRSINGCRW